MRKSLMIVALSGVSAGVAMGDVRVFHASPDTPPVDVYVNEAPDGTPAIGNLAFTQGTPYIALPSDDYTFRATVAGDLGVALEVGPIFLDETVDYTVAAANFLASLEALLYVDDNTTDPNNARIRFIHLSPDAPTVDVGLAGGATLFDAVNFRDSGGYISVPGGVYDLEVRLDADDSVVLPLPGIAVDNGAVYTVFAMGSVAGGDLQAVIAVDVIPAPSSLALLGLGGLLAARRRR